MCWGQVYAASKKGERLRIYNLRYENSFEQDKYAAGLRREQSIFEELIRAKGHMVLPDLHQASRLSWQWHPVQELVQAHGAS